MDKKGFNYTDDVSRATDEFLTLFLGLEDALERTILRYIYSKSGNSFHAASFHQIRDYIVIKNVFCSTDRLRKRLDSLVKFEYLTKESYKGVIIYSCNLCDAKKKVEDGF